MRFRTQNAPFVLLSAESEDGALATGTAAFRTRLYPNRLEYLHGGQIAYVERHGPCTEAARQSSLLSLPSRRTSSTEANSVADRVRQLEYEILLLQQRSMRSGAGQEQRRTTASGTTPSMDQMMQQIARLRAEMDEIMSQLGADMESLPGYTSTV